MTVLYSFFALNQALLLMRNYSRIIQQDQIICYRTWSITWQYGIINIICVSNLQPLPEAVKNRRQFGILNYLTSPLFNMLPLWIEDSSSPLVDAI